METAVKKKYFDELNVFRALIIVWVVIGHSFSPDESVTRFLYHYAYSFHMSAFFMLSGLLFFPKLSRIGSVKDAVVTVWDRFKRLMVPYFVYTVITYVLKLIFSEYAYNELSSDIIVDTLICRNNPNGGIWFLYALFVLSMIAVLVCRIPVWISFIISAALKALSVAVLINIPIVGFICQYSFYFFAGLLLFQYYAAISEKLNRFVSGKKGKSIVLILCMVFLAVSFAVVGLLHNRKIYDYLTVPVTLLGIFTWYIVSFAVCSFKFAKKPAMIIGNYGMDIYVIGYFVQISIRVILGTMLGLPYPLYATMMFLFGLFLPIPISKYIIRKVGIFRAVFLGEFPKKKKSVEKI